MIKNQTSIFKEIADYILLLDPESISNDRKLVLQPLIEFIQKKVAEQDTVRINFICTHNSRRSVLSQVWAQTMALHFDVKNIFCYSGGTESTAVFPKIIETLQKTGFNIEAHSKVTNPIHSIKSGVNEHPIIGFSKKFDDGFNPVSDFYSNHDLLKCRPRLPIYCWSRKAYPDNL